MIRTNFTPFPTLSTDRLILRQLKSSDDVDVFLHRLDPVTNTYLDNFRHTSIEQTQAFIERVQNEIAENRTILWVITEKGNDKFLGTVCFWNIVKEEDKAETGYTLDSNFHGKGYMHEALEKIIDYGFNTMKLKTIEAYTRHDNEPSIRLLRRNNFHQDSSRKAEKEKGENRVVFILESKANL